MSFQAMTWAVGQKCQNAGEKLVLLMLANYCNTHTGRCNPSHKRLAEECAMGTSTLKRHLSRLEEAGLLRIVSMSAEGVSLPNQYDLSVECEGGGSKSGRVSAQIGLGVGPNRATNLELNQEDNQEQTPPTSAKQKKAKSEAMTLHDFTKKCAESGVSVIPADDPIFSYAERVGLPIDYVGLAWIWFKQRYGEGGTSFEKCQLDWRAHFRTAVRRGWPDLWRISQSGEYYLTTAGKQAEREAQA